MDWNPDAPFVLGPQVAVGCREGQQPGIAVGSPAKGIGQFFESTATETIAVWSRYWAGQVPNAFITAELLKAGQEIPSNRVTTVLRPTSSNQFDSTWRNQVDSPTGANLYLSVDEAALNTADYVYTSSPFTTGTGPGPGGRMNFGFSGAAGILTGKRILAVRLMMQGGILAPSGSPVTKLVAGIGAAGIGVKVGIFPVGSGAVGPGQYSTGEIYPGTGLQWTVAQVQALAVGQSVSLQPDNPLPENQNDFIFIYQVWLEIDSCDENRHIRDLAQSIPPGNAWDPGSAQKPDGSTNWSKVSGQDFTMIVRTAIRGDQTPQYTTQQRVSVPYLPLIGRAAPLEAGDFTPYPNVVLGGDGTVTSLGEPASDRMFAMAQRTATDGSVDAQPYAEVKEVPIDATHTAEAEFSGAPAEDYDGIYLPLAVDETNGLVSNLTVALKRRIDNATLATAVITRDVALAFPVEEQRRFWRMVQQDFAVSATLAPATRYYLAFSSPGPGSWIIQLLTALAPVGASPTGEATFNGLGDVATVNGVDDSRGDFAVLVYQAPEAVEDFAITPITITLPDENDCDVDGLTGMQLEWTPVDDSDNIFGYYEMQRMDEFTDWATIYRSDGRVLAFSDVYLDEYTDLYDGGYAPGGGINASHIYDWEGRIGVESCYRIRQVNRFAIAGPWSDVLCDTRPGGGCGYQLASNTIDPLLFVVYPDAYTSNPNRGFTFPEADEVSYRRIYGRNNFIALRPTERRGVKFDRSLWINALVGIAEPQQEAFDALRDLCANTELPYIAVCDESGGRVFASVVCPDANIRYPDAWYFGTIRVTQIADLPTP